MKKSNPMQGTTMSRDTALGLLRTSVDACAAVGLSFATIRVVVNDELLRLPSRAVGKGTPK